MRHTDTSPASPFPSNPFSEPPSGHSSTANAARPDGDHPATVVPERSPQTVTSSSSSTTSSTATDIKQGDQALEEAWQRPPISYPLSTPPPGWQNPSGLGAAESQPNISEPSLTTHSASSPRYVWVTHGAPINNPQANRNSSQANQRYQVISSYVWRDTQPHLPCTEPKMPLSSAALAYLRFYPYALHLPTLYGEVLPQDAPPEGSPLNESQPSQPLLLLDNVPIDATGDLLPSIQDCWAAASPLRQVNWLWQLAELWHILSRWNQTATLLEPENIRVEGWRVRLVEVWSNDQWDQGKWLDGRRSPLRMDRSSADQFWNSQDHGLQPRPINGYLAQLWQSWAENSARELVEPLRQICTIIQQPHVIWSHVKRDLNLLLLQQAAQRPLRLAIAGGSQVGATRSHNEDTCYPNTERQQTVHETSGGLAGETTPSSPSARKVGAEVGTTGAITDYDVSAIFRAPKPWEELDPYVGIVCDGLAGHVRGELASQLVTRSLKLQLGAFLTEVESQKTTDDLITPDVVVDQLAAIIRIVNNVLLAQGQPSVDRATGNERVLETRGTAAQATPSKGRDRMATTAVFAVQLPQAIMTEQGLRNSHELYIVSVGDSRAYWLTPTACHPLTQDDTVVSRHMMGQMMSQVAGQRTGTSGDRTEVQPQSYHDAQLQPNASQLAQALGTKDGDALTIQVQRLVVDEDGVLLLCSDGLSHGNHIEHHWQSLTSAIFRDELSLDDAVKEWLAMGQDGYGDDVSVVMMQCGVSSAPPPTDNQSSEGAEAPDSNPIFNPALLMPEHRIDPRSNNDDPSSYSTNASSTAESMELPSKVAEVGWEKDNRTCPSAKRFNGHTFVLPVLHKIGRLFPRTSPMAESTVHGDGISNNAIPNNKALNSEAIDPTLAIANEHTQEMAPSWHWRQLLLGSVVSMGLAIALSLAAWRYLDPVLFDRVVVQSAEQLIEKMQVRLGGETRNETPSQP